MFLKEIVISMYKKLTKKYRRNIPVELYAPHAYENLTTELKTKICNGCGPSGWKGRLILDHVYGIYIGEACNIHDYMYEAGLTLEDKDEADRVFLNNLLRIVDAGTESRWMRALTHRRVLTYYTAVSLGGGPYFWNDKNPVENRIVVAV